MKKIILTFLFSFAVLQLVHAQWTASGTNIYNSNSGNVGIGTTAPASKLDINGGLAIKGLIVNDTQTLSIPADGTYVIASGTRIKGTYTITFEATPRIQTVVLLANGTHYDSNSSLSILSNTSYGGNVAMSNFRFVFNSDNSTIYLIFDIANRNGGVAATAHFDGTGYYVPNWGGTLPPSPINVGVYPLVVNMGNVLIGQTFQNNPAYKLDVAGSVRANQITVNVTGADFVFDPSYKLTPLATLEEYIVKNHHLPEIISAKQMQTDGLNVGDNEVKLLQKIEELTLYMIDKDKQLSDQELEIKELKLEMEQLKQGTKVLINSK